ncbi:Uncharacterized protein PCOAH_00024970 [Plasmodium coatneyi]|uniref:Uncharacterized protein n=1 Tax=Plasmodium coatneyi TaxID=208452 RepID=A0A1B1DZZ8_9APIC|nr:Uncharacterized protein PCOAH_00024970 [Plasmodium coatneyi]ANQ08354.1 Uncharacterized protein PCOAH_00024970 [Plasmodium coatneyi]
MLSAKSKFEIARNRSCSSIRENLMCSSVILKNSSCLLKSNPTFENTTQLDRQGEGLHGDVASLEEDPLRERSAKDLHQYVYTSGINPDDAAIFTSNEWTKDNHDVNNEFKKGILFDKIVMSNRTYNTAVESVHSNFQTNKLENVVNSIKFEENTSIKIPSYLRNSPLYVLYPELDYLKGGREEAQPEGRDDVGNPAQAHQNVAPSITQNKNLNSYLRYTLNNSHATGRNRMYDYFESNKKNMVEIANPNDLNHTLLYTKKNTPTELIYNLYKNRYVTSRSNHTDNELNTLNTLKRLKMPFIEKNEKGENIVITSEVNAKRRVNLLSNDDSTKERMEEGTKLVNRGGKHNYTVSLIDMSNNDKASIKTVHLSNGKTGGEKKNIFPLKKKTRKDVQVQTNQDDFEEAAKCDVDSDVERVMSILEGKKKKNASPEDPHVGNSPRKGEKGTLSISYCDINGSDESGEDTPTQTDDSGEVNVEDEAVEVKTETHANTNAEATDCKSVSPNQHPRMTHVMQKHNQFLRARRSRGGLNRTVLKKQLSGSRRCGPFMRGKAHLNGAKVSPGSGNDGIKEPNGWDGSPPIKYNPIDKLTIGWCSPLARGRAPFYLGGNMKKAVLIPKVSTPWVHNASFIGSRIGRENSPSDNAVTYDPSIGNIPDVLPNELKNSEPRPSRVYVYVKNSAPGGPIQRCDTGRPVKERNAGTACEEECEKEKITNDLLLKKLYIEKKRQLYEKRKFERAIASMLEKRAVLRERARDKYSRLVSIHGSGHIGGVGNVGDESSSSAEWEGDTLLRTLRCARNPPNRTYKRAYGSGAWRDTTQGDHEKGHVSSCSNVNLYSSNEESDGGFRKRVHNATRNYSAQAGRRSVGSQFTEQGEQNWVNTISSRTPLEAVVKKRRSDNLTNERSNGGIFHKFIPKSWRGRVRRFAPDDKRLRSLSYKNRVSKLSVLEKSIQPLKEHARRNVILGGGRSDVKCDEKEDIIRSEINRCVERGGYGESGDETEHDSTGGSTDEGKKHLLDENKSTEDEQKGGIKITYNLGRIVKRGKPTSYEWVHKENTFISPLNGRGGRIGESQDDRNEDQTENIEMEDDSYRTLGGDEKRETSPAEKKNTMGISSVTSGDLQYKKTNEADRLFRVKVSIKKAGERGKEIDKRSSNVQEGSNPIRYVLHESVHRMGSTSYKENANNGFIKRTGLVPKEKGNFSDTEVTTRKRNSETITKKGDESNDHPDRRTFLRKNDGHGGGDYLKMKQKESANMRSQSHSKFSNQREESRETLRSTELTPKCNSPLCRGRSNEMDRLLDLERIDPNKWIQKIFGDTH